MSETPCVHHSEGLSLLRPDERNPSKVFCSGCGERWRPVRGEFWIHKDEVDADRVALVAAYRRKEEPGNSGNGPKEDKKK